MDTDPNDTVQQLQQQLADCQREKDSCLADLLRYRQGAKRAGLPSTTVRQVPAVGHNVWGQGMLGLVQPQEEEDAVVPNNPAALQQAHVIAHQVANAALPPPSGPRSSPFVGGRAKKTKRSRKVKRSRSKRVRGKAKRPTRRDLSTCRAVGTGAIELLIDCQREKKGLAALVRNTKKARTTRRRRRR